MTDQWATADGVTHINATGGPIPEGATFQVLEAEWNEDYTVRTLKRVLLLAVRGVHEYRPDTEDVARLFGVPLDAVIEPTGETWAKRIADEDRAWMHARLNAEALDLNAEGA